MYFLAHHAYVCRSGELTIILDLRRDKYLALDPASSSALKDLVAGWPKDLCGLGRPPDADVEELTADLRQQGLLTVDSHAGKAVDPMPFKGVIDSLIDDDPRKRPEVNVRQIAQFLRASTTAALLLRLRSLEHVVNRNRTRKARLYDNDVHRLNALVSAFEALRPFFFTSKDACLFHALALCEFLALNGLHADWVFGVRTPPFSAHCWVQHGTSVLNDIPDRVRRFRPIMIA